MPYAATMRVQPVMRGKIGGLTAHNARSEEYAKKTTHIDPERVKNNKVLFGTASPGQDLSETIAGVPMARRGVREAEEYVGAEIIMTAHERYFQGLTPEAFERWKDANLAWLKSEFDAQGRGRLVNVILHMDEKAPHMHAVIAPIIQASRIHPVTKEQMPAKPKLNYSAIFGDRPDVLAKARKEGRSHLDTQLGRLQTSYGHAMDPCGLVRGKESRRTQEPDVKHVAPHVYRQIADQINALEKQIEILNAQKTELENTYIYFNNACNEVKKNYEDWQAAIERLPAEYAARSEELKGQFQAQLDEEKSRIEAEHKAATARIEQEQRALQVTIINDLNFSKAERAFVQNKLNSIKEEMSIIENERVALEQIRDELNKEITVLNQSISNGKAEIANLRTEYTKSVADMKSALKQEHDMFDKDRNNLVKEIDNAKGHLNNINALKETIEREIQELETTKETRAAEIKAELKNELSGIDADIELTRKMLKVTKDLVATAEEAKRDIEKELEEMRNEKIALEKERDTIQNEIPTLKETKERYEGYIKTHDKSITEQEQRLATLEKQQPVGAYNAILAISAYLAKQEPDDWKHSYKDVAELLKDAFTEEDCKQIMSTIPFSAKVQIEQQFAKWDAEEKTKLAAEYARQVQEQGPRQSRGIRL